MPSLLFRCQVHIDRWHHARPSFCYEMGGPSGGAIGIFDAKTPLGQQRRSAVQYFIPHHCSRCSQRRQIYQANQSTAHLQGLSAIRKTWFDWRFPPRHIRQTAPAPSGFLPFTIKTWTENQPTLGTPVLIQHTVKMDAMPPQSTTQHIYERGKYDNPPTL